MIEKTCRCGKTKKNFKIDIGPFFIDDCCVAAGYDHLGKKKVEVGDLGLDKSKVEQALNSEETQSLEIVDEGEQPDPQEETQPEETKQESTEEVDMDKEVEEVIQSFSATVETEMKDGETLEQAEQRVVDATLQRQAPKKKRQYNRNGKLNIKKES